MDMDALIAEVAKRHRFVLSPDDPALVVVTLVELAWREAGRELETRLAETLAATNSDAVLSGMQIMLRNEATTLRAQINAAQMQAQEDLSANLIDTVELLQQAATDATQARRWAFVAAGLSGGIALGIVLVLTAPIWGASLGLGG